MHICYIILFWGILYGILNNDTMRSIYPLYNIYKAIIGFLFVYKIIEEFFDSNFSFFMIILMPTYIPLNYTNLGLLSVICLIYAIKRNMFWSYFIY